MKRFLALIAFTLVLVATVAAQGNGGGNGNGNNPPGGQANGGGNGNGPAWQAPSGIPWGVALRALWEASPYFQQQMSLTYGQLIVKYAQGVCTITLVATNPPTNNTYRVAIGGNGIILILDNF